MDSVAYLIFLTILALSIKSAFGRYPTQLEEQIKDYPDITGKTSACLPQGDYPSGELLVCDPDSQLLKNDIQELNKRLQSIRKDDDKSCDPNHPYPSVAIAIVKDMKVSSNELPYRIIGYAKVFSYHLYQRWNLPSSCSDKTDKIIIFVSKENGVVYTLAGDLMAKKLPSEKIISLTVKSNVSFKNSLFDGLRFLVNSYKDELSK